MFPERLTWFLPENPCGHLRGGTGAQQPRCSQGRVVVFLDGTPALHCTDRDLLAAALTVGSTSYDQGAAVIFPLLASGRLLHAFPVGVYVDKRLEQCMEARPPQR